MCNWCTYGAADLAGVGRMNYPPNIRAIRVMCSATVSPHHILKAFQSGADGVLVGGCHIGDCHYICGNTYASQRVDHAARLLEEIGLEPERVRMINVSAAMAEQFVIEVTNFVEAIEALGPSPLSRKTGKPRVAKDSDLKGASHDHR